jgi:hypothetical protein
MEWQPIETAPKDGTDILMYGEDVGIAAGCYYTREEAGCFAGWFGTCADGRVNVNPTHWMPLPPAPSSTQQGEGK